CEVDHVADAHAVPPAIVDALDRRSLDAEHLADQRNKPRHRTSKLAREDLDELVHLLVVRVLVHEHADLPVAFGHDLRRVRDRGHLEPGDVRALDLALADAEHERDAAIVVRRAVVESEVARAHQLARARLGVASLQVPGHLTSVQVELDSRTRREPGQAARGHRAAKVYIYGSPTRVSSPRRAR